MPEKFPGFPEPNWTKVPNELLETFMPILGDAELRVALFVTRKTLGWHKEDDDLSLAQFMEGTGLSKPSVIAAIASLEERGLIVRLSRGPNKAYNYRLNIKSSKATLPPPDLTSKEGLQDTDETSKATLPQLVKQVYTQKKGKKSIKETIAADAVLPLGKGNETDVADGPTPTPAPPHTPPPKPEPPSSPLQGKVGWDDVQSAPAEARSGPPRFENDDFGWYGGLIWVTTGQTRYQFEQTKSKAVQDKYRAQAHRHYSMGRDVMVMVEKFGPGGWRYQAHPYRTGRPQLSEIDSLWGDWEQTPVLTLLKAPSGTVPFVPTPTRPTNLPSTERHNFTPEQIAEMRRKALEEQRRAASSA